MFGSVHETWSREQGDYLTTLGKQTTGMAWHGMDELCHMESMAHTTCNVIEQEFLCAS